MSDHVWEGVLSEFPPEPVDAIFETERWVGRTSEATQQSLVDLNRAWPEVSLVSEYPLPPVIACLAAHSREPVKILDFGGGMATSYFPLRASLPPNVQFEFHIVESALVCAKGREIFSQKLDVIFHEEMPERASYHVVHAGASLHYVKDWKAMILAWMAYNPSHIVLSGLTAGEIPTFVTHQNYYGSRVPVWFWNVNEVIEHFESAGYALFYKSLLASQYRGEVRPLPMDNLPEINRLKRKCNLIFVRKPQ